MDLLDRLLGHDAWTTRRPLLRCRELTDAQLDQPFDVGNGSVRRTLAHMIGNVEVWTDLLHERPVRRAPASRERGESVAGLLARHDTAMAEFGALARGVADDGRLDELWTDVLDDPPTQKTRGGAIAHVLTHDMHHRAELLHMLARLGLKDLPEGDVLSWEQTLTSAEC